MDKIGSDAVFAGSVPELYDTHMVPLIFEPYAQDLARRVAALKPARVLETAAGTGVVTRALARALPAGTEIIATDLNQAMLDRAAAVGAQQPVRWQQADAMQLPFDAASVDVVVCQFGAMFFPDRVAGYAEARRVITPGGALMFNVWAEVERHSYERAFVQALRRVFPDDPPTFLETVPHGYADRARIEADVRAAGFTDVAAETVEVSSGVTSIADLIVGYCEGTPVRGEIAARGDLAELTPRIVAEVESILGPGPLTGTMAAHEIVASTSR